MEHILLNLCEQWQKYKNCNLKKENIFLTKSQVQKIKKNYDYHLSSLVLRFHNSCNDSYVYIDSHNVRTLNETVILEVKEEKIISLEVASFMEPPEYIAPSKWIALLIKNGEEVDSLTGATITENAIKRVYDKYKIMNHSKWFIYTV